MFQQENISIHFKVIAGRSIASCIHLGEIRLLLEVKTRQFDYGMFQQENVSTHCGVILTMSIVSCILLSEIRLPLEVQTGQFECGISIVEHVCWLYHGFMAVYQVLFSMAFL